MNVAWPMVLYLGCCLYTVNIHCRKVHHARNYEELLEDVASNWLHKRHVNSFKRHHHEHDCNVKKQYRATSNDFQLSVDTLRRIVDFFLLNKNAIIVDGMFGIRAVQGTLGIILKHLNKNSEDYESLKQLHSHFTQAAHIVFKSMKKRMGNYSKVFLPLIEQPIAFQRPWRNYRTELIFKSNENLGSIFSESLSDKCICSILGTWKEKGKCFVTNDCLKIETKINTNGYELTHQLLYFLAGEAHGCRSKFLELLESPSDLKTLYDGFASNVAMEMLVERAEADRLYEVDNLDLYFEQGYIAASFGITNAINFKDLRETISLVDEHGCIKQDDVDYQSKRQDKLIQGCSQHLMSVAMGYISQHIRFMVKPPPCKLLEEE